MSCAVFDWPGIFDDAMERLARCRLAEMAVKRLIENVACFGRGLASLVE